MQLTGAFNRIGLLFLFVLLLIHSNAPGQASRKIVYVTKTGEKYHIASCRYLKYSNIEIEIGKAKELGYTGCSVCKPGAGTSKPNTGGNTAEKAIPSGKPGKSETGTSQQCSATTKAGTRCKRMTSETNGKCWQHQ